MPSSSSVFLFVLIKPVKTSFQKGLSIFFSLFPQHTLYILVLPLFSLDVRNSIFGARAIRPYGLEL